MLNVSSFCPHANFSTLNCSKLLNIRAGEEIQLKSGTHFLHEAQTHILPEAQTMQVSHSIESRGFIPKMRLTRSSEGPIRVAEKRRLHREPSACVQPSR